MAETNFFANNHKDKNNYKEKTTITKYWKRRRWENNAWHNGTFATADKQNETELKIEFIKWKH